MGKGCPKAAASTFFEWSHLPTAPPKQEAALEEPAGSSSPRSRSKVIRVTFREAMNKQTNKGADQFILAQPVDPSQYESTSPFGFRSCRFGGFGTSMADVIPLIPKVSSLVIRTGNIVNWNRLKRKPNHTPTVEVGECITATLTKYLDASDKTQLQYVKELECTDPALQQPLLAEERGELKVITKIFVCSAQQPPSVLCDAVDRVMADLGVTFLETVLLSLSMFETEEELTVEQLQPYWAVLEGMVADEKILSIGVAGLDRTKLEQLYTWAKVKPCINQVNLASCCVMPQDMTDYAKQVDIQLLTHNDPPELLPTGYLQERIRQVGTEQDGFGWGALWVARYSVIIKNRGIIKSKGYIVRTARDPHRRM